MKLEDLLERLKEELKITWDRIQNSSLYIQAKERYEELDTNVQKLLKYAGSFLIIYFILSFPLSWMQEASNNKEQYQKNRELIESLLEVQNELKNSLDINIAINSNEIEASIRQELQKTNLAQSQIKSTNAVNNENRKIDFLPDNVSYVGVSLNVEQLNLTQILDIGTRLSNLSNSTKLIEMDVKKNARDDHYYDVEYLVAAFTGKE